MGNETPTNDAPVTVEQAVENIRGLIADLEGEHQVMVGKPMDRSAWSLDVKVTDLDAILAVLASAPAYPSLELCVQFSDDGQHIRKWSRIPFEGGTDFYSHPASAPAGDGLVEAAFKEGIATGYQCGKADEDTTDEWHSAWLASDASVAAALARPRAAVGERAWDGVVATDPCQSADETDEDGNPCWFIEIQSVGGHSIVATIWGGSPEEVQSRADAILALQSPPAKVEG